MDGRILPKLGLPDDDRHLLHRTQASAAPVREHHHVSRKSSTRTRTTEFLITKNERTRQRPFDEALQAKLQWMSQNWRTYFSQPSSSSTSSQNWWQHELKTLNGMNTKTPNGEITNGKITNGKITNGEITKW